MKRTRSWQVILLAALVWMWTGAALAAETPETQSIRKRRGGALVPGALSPPPLPLSPPFSPQNPEEGLKVGS